MVDWAVGRMCTKPRVCTLSRPGDRPVGQRAKLVFWLIPGKDQRILLRCASDTKKRGLPLKLEMDIPIYPSHQP